MVLTHGYSYMDLTQISGKIPKETHSVQTCMKTKHQVRVYLSRQPHAWAVELYELSHTNTTQTQTQTYSLAFSKETHRHGDYV